MLNTHISSFNTRRNRVERSVKRSFFFFFRPQCGAYGILLPQPGVEPGPPQGKYQVLITGRSGHSRKEVIIQQIQGGVRESASLTSTQVMVMLLGSEPNWSNESLTRPSRGVPFVYRTGAKGSLKCTNPYDVGYHIIILFHGFSVFHFIKVG